MRLDKFLCETGRGSRREVKELIRKGRVAVNGTPATSAELHINEKNDRVTLDGQELVYYDFHYFMMNKPQGVITATRDDKDRTVLDLLSPQDRAIRNLSPVGRLDKDTEGLLLLTDDGALSHHLLSPKHHVEKLYEVQLRDEISAEAIQRLEAGVDIGDEKPTLPARAKLVLADGEKIVIHLSIIEGRYHQVKRMLKAVDNEVIFLKRLSMGALRLDETLKPGEYRALTEEETAMLIKTWDQQGFEPERGGFYPNPPTTGEIAESRASIAFQASKILDGSLSR